VRLTYRRLKPEAVLCIEPAGITTCRGSRSRPRGAIPAAIPWRDLPLNVEELRAAGVLPW